MSTEPITRAIARTLKEATNGFLNELIMPFHYKKRRQMHTQIKRKLAPITRAKLHILYSKSKEAMKVKRSLFEG